MMIKKCICGHAMSQSRLSPYILVCHRCGRKISLPAVERDDLRTRLSLIISRMSTNELSDLVDELEEKYEV